jgi:hypothetical protein
MTRVKPLNPKLQWGVRFSADSQVDVMRSRDECLKHIARVDDGGEIVLQLLSQWIPETVLDGVAERNIPAVECHNCKGTNLGFEVSATGNPSRVEFYQGCNDCSETLWTGDWELFHAVLALIYDIRIPRLD